MEPPRGLIPNDERPVLAGHAGRYVEALPIPALRSHFQCVWINSFDGGRAIPIAVVPDGCVDLIWRNGRLTVVGPDTYAAKAIVQPGTTFVGLRFRPGAAANWLGVPLREIVGLEVPMAEIWGRHAGQIADRLAQARGIGDKVRDFQAAVLKHGARVGRPSPAASAIFEFLSADREDEDRKIESLRDRLDMSERTLRRRSIEQFGYGPKMLDRILRLQRFRALAQTKPDTQLADLAFGAGYADQAHLSREVLALCDMTAGEFVRQLRR